jgi:hypothetical protein
MKITERRLRSIIRSVIKESSELGTWNDTQGKLNPETARSFMLKNKKEYRYPEDFEKLKARMPGNYPLINPDGGGTRDEMVSLMAYGEHIDAFIPLAAYENEMDNKRFVIIKTMAGHEYFQVEIPK